MMSHTVLPMALFGLAAVASPISNTFSGPPVGVYQTGPSQPLVTATTLGSAIPTVTQFAKRDAATTCYPQPTGISYTPSVDSASAFRADPFFASQASSAPVPVGFQSSFTNGGASPNADKYLGFTLLDSYNVQKCADKCNAIAGCTSFNIYFERDPSVNPDSDSCANPSSVTNVKCVWWGSVITPPTIVNFGQFRNQFEVAIAGSNGYTGLPTQRGFRIRTGGSNTNMDNRWLAVSPGEGAAVALNEATFKAQSSVFQFGPKGQLLQLSPFNGMAGVSPNTNGKWDLLQYRAVGQTGTNYLNCSGDYLINCQASSGWQYAGVCSNKVNGLLYFGLPQNMPAGCKWIGLYIDINI